METTPQRKILVQSIKNSLGICDGSCVGVKGCVRFCRENVSEALEYYHIDPVQLSLVGSRPQLTQRQTELLENYLGVRQSSDNINLEDSSEPPASAFGGKMVECADDEL